MRTKPQTIIHVREDRLSAENEDKHPDHHGRQLKKTDLNLPYYQFGVADHETRNDNAHNSDCQGPW